MALILCIFSCLFTHVCVYEAVCMYMQVYALPFNLHCNFYLQIKDMHFGTEHLFL